MTFELLIGKRAFGSASSKDYTQWAESLLCEHVDSENVAILASMGYERDSDSDEVETYFRKSLEDLDLSLPDQEEGLKIYARIMCNKILSNDIDPEYGVEILETFHSKSGYAGIYAIWSDLGEDIWMIDNDRLYLSNSQLTAENKNDYIKSVAAQFIELLNVDLPDRFFYLCVCTECGYIGESAFEVVEKAWMPGKLFRFIFRRHQYRQAICASCKKPSLISMSDYDGRKRYLARYC